MDNKEKKTLSESDICDLFITSAINKEGRNTMTQIRREVTLTPGPMVLRGNMFSRKKRKKRFADYVFSWEPSVLPPTQEQHRIVAKIDELMAKCDVLKARLAGAQVMQLYRADTIVEQALG